MGAKPSRTARIVVPVEVEVIKDPVIGRAMSSSIEQDAGQPTELVVEVDGCQVAALFTSAGRDLDDLDVRLVLGSSLG